MIIIFIELWLMFLLDHFCSQSFVFVCSLTVSGLKIKNYLKINMLIINYKMDIESLQIKSKYYYDCDDIIIYNFDFDIGSSDRYLVVNTNNEIIINIFNKLWKFIENKIISDDSNNEIKEYYKLRFDSDLHLPVDTLIEFHSLIINVSCVIEKDNEYYPEIYLDACLYNKAKL